jgi:acyl carrier protein
MSNLDVFLDVVADTFKISRDDIKDESTPDDIEKWDSVTHMDLLAKFEQAFKVNFDMEEISEMQTIGMIKQILRKKGVGL